MSGTRHLKGIRTEALILRLAPLLVLLAGLLLTGVSAFLARRSAEQGAAQVFHELVREIENKIRFQIQAYVSALLQTRGLFALHGEPTREQFREYIASSGILSAYPGVQGIGYSKRLSKDELSDYAVYPSFEREEYTATVMLEPLDWRNQRAIGFDMFSEPVRRAAMTAARDSGLPAITGEVKLVQETEVRTQPGFLIYVPLYRSGAPIGSVEERRQALVGYIYSPFRAHDLFRAMVRSMYSVLGTVYFAVYDDAPGSKVLLFDHGPSPDAPPTFRFLVSDFPIYVLGRSWRVHVQALPKFTSSFDDRAPFYVLGVGAVVSLLLFWTVLAANRRRATAEARSRRDRFLADVNAVFGSSTDYHATLERTANVAVPSFADWCLVEVVEDEGKPSRVAVAHCDPDKLRLVHERASEEPIFGLTAEHAAGKVFRTGQAELIEQLPDTTLASLNRGARDPALASTIPLSSLLCVPLTGDGRVFGTISFLTADSRRRYDRDDLTTAREVATRASMAIENSRLLRATQTVKSERELILNSTAEGIYGLDRQGRTSFVNQAAARMAGWELEELLGQSQHQLLHHSYPDGSPYPVELCPIYSALRDGATHHSDSEVFWRKDGTSFPVEYTSTPLRKDGEVVGAVVVFRDISERKRAERELQQAKLAAESASQAKSNFLANMSHEIRTPLTAIMGFTQLLLDPSLSEADRQAFASTIERNGRLLMQIIDDILDLSKIESGKMSTERIACSLPGVVSDVTRMLAPQAWGKGIALRVAAEPAVPARIVTDPTRLKQILINIVGNAIKFTETGAVEVHCRLLESGAGHPPKLAFVVKDTGRGIPPERQSELFRAFTQADSSTTRKFGGTGLGLALSRRLAEALGGTVELTSSAPGEGSTFTITVLAEEASGRFELEAVQRDGDVTPSPTMPRRTARPKVQPEDSWEPS
jgi:PAS domain S-box-containing protein